jgi:hypothetical protein
MVASGAGAYVPPDRAVPKPGRYEPHIFTAEELCHFLLCKFLSFKILPKEGGCAVKRDQFVEVDVLHSFSCDDVLSAHVS